AFRFVMTTDSTSVTVPPRKAETVVERTAALPSSPSLGRERARRREHPLPPRRQQKAGRDKWLTAARYSSRALALLIFLSVAQRSRRARFPLPPQPGRSPDSTRSARRRERRPAARPR